MKVNNYTIKNVSEILNCTPMTVYRYIQDGKIPMIKIAGKYQISETRFNEWYEALYEAQYFNG
jgi:excisionase family DNA binding protein